MVRKNEKKGLSRAVSFQLEKGIFYPDVNLEVIKDDPPFKDIIWRRFSHLNRE